MEHRKKTGSAKRRQGIFWLLTIPFHEYTPWLAPELQWIKGQLELGEKTSYLHWQLVCAFRVKQSLAGCRSFFGPFNAELTYCDGANEYVGKESTRVAGTSFEFGSRPFAVNKPYVGRPDYEDIWASAVKGDLQSVPASIRLRSYFALRCIASDYARPEAMDRSCDVLWGVTGAGKSITAWQESGAEAYAKDPRSKFWCGYRGQEHVVIDEFRGGIDIAHLLRWLGGFPVIVEIKGSAVPLCARRFWITSNLDPEFWYPDSDYETRAALKRRLNIRYFDNAYLPNN